METTNMDEGATGESFSFADTPVSNTDQYTLKSSTDQYSLPHAKAIDLIGEEFVPRLKTEPDDNPLDTDGDGIAASTSISCITQSSSDPTTVTAGADQSSLVYCNLTDLDFNTTGDNYTSLTPLSTLSAAPPSYSSGGDAGLNLGNVQNMTKDGGGGLVSRAEMMGMVQSSGGGVQMVQAVPSYQMSTTDAKSPYSAVSTILLHGGILQLKPGSEPISASNPQQLLIPVDSKIGRTGSARMLSQVAASSGGGGQAALTSRPQDAIASILAGMNNVPSTGVVHQVHQAGVAGTQQPGQLLETAGPSQTRSLSQLPVDYSTTVNAGVQEISPGLVTVQQGQLDQSEMVPLNLATGGVQTSDGQTIHVQGMKRVLAQSNNGGLLTTKKVIIATINGTQRILTPVSAPQMIAVKSNPLERRDGSFQQPQGTPLTIIQQKTIGQPKPQQRIQITPSAQAMKSIDNKTCRWKFENGQICGKVFTKTYNLTVHMRMHQDIRPFPCTICEQTFRQKAHLQRHEATHGIDSTGCRKRRKKSISGHMDQTGQGVIRQRRLDLGEESDMESDEDNNLYRPYSSEDVRKRKFSVGTMKKESPDDLDIDPMIEPIEPESDGPKSDMFVKKGLCPVNVGTNTEFVTPDVDDTGLHQVSDEIEADDLEPVRYRPTVSTAAVGIQVDQGQQYSEADLLPESLSQSFEQSSATSGIDAPHTQPVQTQVTMAEFMERGSDDLQEEMDTKGNSTSLVEDHSPNHTVNMTEASHIRGGVIVSSQQVKTENTGESVITYSSGDNHQHFVTGSDGQLMAATEADIANAQLVTQASDGSFIDASTNQIVMSSDGSGIVSSDGSGIVSLVPVPDGGDGGQGGVVMEGGGGSQVVNIVTTTTTNEAGEQIVIIENLDQHSPELQREILNALLADGLHPVAQ